MHIALLPSADLSYESGSVIHAKRLMAFLHEQGHEVCVLASRAPSGLSDELMRHVTVDHHVLEHPVIDDRPISDAELAGSLCRSLSFLIERHTLRPLDIVHAQHLSFTSLAAATFGAATGTPVVVTSFGRDVHIGIPFDPRLAGMAHLSLPGVSHLIASNEVVRAQLQILSERAHKRVPITIIPPPLDPSVLEYREPLAAPGRPLLATVNSCFTPEKGIETTLCAFAQVRKQIAGATLIVAGTDDHPMQVNRNRLLGLARDLELAESVRFVGYLSRARVGALLAAADVFVDARTTGNFSSVVLEAQFVNAAVVCSDVPSARLMVEDGRNGLLFQAGDSESLATKLIALLSSPERQAALRRGCRQWCKDEGSVYQELPAMQRIESIYRQVAAHD